MLRIKKQYKQPDGTMIEVEGSEAELEAYEKKQQKKNESAQRKKEILHGKAKKLAAKALASKEALEELRKFISDEMAKKQAIKEVHHWYYNNGWWWRPWWVDGTVTYLYSQTQPTVTYNGDTSVFYSSTNANDVGKSIGLAANTITNKTPSATTGWYGNAVATNTTAGNLITSNAVNTIGLGSTATNYTLSTACSTTDNSIKASNWSIDDSQLKSVLGSISTSNKKYSV